MAEISIPIILIGSAGGLLVADVIRRFYWKRSIRDLLLEDKQHRFLQDNQNMKKKIPVYPPATDSNREADLEEIILDNKKVRIINIPADRLSPKKNIDKNLIVHSLVQLFKTGHSIAKVVINEYRDANVAVRYYDTTGRIIHKDIIPDVAKSTALQIGNSYLDKLEKIENIDPELISIAKRRLMDRFSNQD